jgi:hypothetical protein
MAYDDIAAETNGMSQLSSMGPPSGGMQSAPVGAAGLGAGGSPTPPPGGPGADTPQEQQALQLLLQGATMMRRATEIEPSIRYIIDDLLQKAYLGVTKHYGLEQEGKLALQQAKLQADRGRAVALTGPPKPRQMGPSTGGSTPTGPMGM